MAIEGFQILLEDADAIPLTAKDLVGLDVEEVASIAGEYFSDIEKETMGQILTALEAGDELGRADAERRWLAERMNKASRG